MDNIIAVSEVEKPPGPIIPNALASPISGRPRNASTLASRNNFDVDLVDRHVALLPCQNTREPELTLRRLPVATPFVADKLTEYF
jgi:hypothetical protein